MQSRLQIAPDGLAITWKLGGAPSGQVAGRLGASIAVVLPLVGMPVIFASRRETDTHDALVVSPLTPGPVHFEEHLELLLRGELPPGRPSGQTRS
ncbi:MAG: hypothetical protein GY724_27615 [Actinomycetia bacterium]|nr:hypothetical protein [Actinomycetes bacterium]